MENYEKADQFLADCKKGKSSFVVIYEVRQDGGINRMKFTYDGIDMYVISTSGIWMKNDIPGIAYTSYTRIKEWEYTENGWFCYKLCVPEPPEVTEIKNGSQALRINQGQKRKERCPNYVFRESGIREIICYVLIGT